MLTVSNHRPYAYPTGRIDKDPARKRRSHAVRYTDWALARFMAQARQHGFYDHTLFVLMGDHGARVYGAAEIPLHSYEVPVLLVAPGVVPAGATAGPAPGTDPVGDAVAYFDGADILYRAGGLRATGRQSASP